MNLEYKFEDLTVNLPTLDFNLVIQEENDGHIHLRSRSHCLFINSCLHSYYYLYILNIYRKACSRILKKGTNIHLTKFMLDIDDEDDLKTKVGIIGYGRLGSSICKDFIESKIVLPTDLIIYTRNQDKANKIKDKGVVLDKDCTMIPEQCSVIFICVLASNIEAVANKLRNRLESETILYIFTSGISLARLKFLFKHEGIITEKYLWNDGFSHYWDYKLKISEVMAKPCITILTCPLPMTITKAVFINCLPKLFTLWIYSLCNISSLKGLSAEYSVKLLNFVLFDLEQQKLIEICDIVEGLGSVRDSFPTLSLSDITERSTFIDIKIENDEHFQEELLKSYQNVINTFSNFKKFNID